MPKSWTTSIINKLDPDLFNGLTITRDYGRTIINVDWLVVKIVETTTLGHDSLVMTCLDESTNDMYDCIIIEQSYPGSVTTHDEIIGQRVTGVNPMCEYERKGDGHRPALLCKYMRMVLGSTRKFNPHVAIDNHVHERIAEQDSPLYHSGYDESDFDSTDRSYFADDSASSPSDSKRNESTELKPGMVVTPTPDVTIKWV